MSVQVKDSIIIKGDKYYLYTTPLDSYWTKRNLKPPIRPTKSTCWRGYIATWEIFQESLYLINILFYSHHGNLGLDYLFPDNTGKVKANWYTGELQIPIGDELYREHMEDPIYDSNWYISIKKGKILSQRYQANY
jgi:hypothetical protein